MSNRTNARRKAIWGIIVFACFADPSGLSGQDVPHPPQHNAIAHQPFDGLDESLSRAADSLLVSATPQIPAIITRADADKGPSSNHVWNSPAATRLSLLSPVVEPILKSHGIPESLSAVILVESGGHADAQSSKGARGLWQLMPATARRYGLRVDEFRDDRLDLLRATGAAAQYLHDLYAQFGDWRLALAAYNTGEANVGRAILRARTQDFDQLTSLRMLPLETRNYVPRVLAAAQIIGPTPNFMQNHDPTDVKTVFAVAEPPGARIKEQPSDQDLARKIR
jgi:Transglycosylase SLT domain